MEILLSNSSDEPIYEQITSQIKAMIMKGTLKSGDALPSMRKLAKELHVSVITAQRAYEELQRDGFIDTVAGKRNLCGSAKPRIYPRRKSTDYRTKIGTGRQNLPGKMIYLWKN